MDLSRTFDEPRNVEHRGEKPEVGADRRAEQEAHRAVKPLWEQWCSAKKSAVADEGRPRPNIEGRGTIDVFRAVLSLRRSMRRKDSTQ